MKAANPLYVPTDISRAPKPRTDRPARQQITEEPKEATDNVVGEYNIWYHRHLGYDAKTAKAETRINVAEDTGMTTASLATGTICLNFARGNCIRGHKCHWKHQVPTEDDELRVSMLKDVFGRGRHGTDKEEMDGTGNFNKNNRTIYMGGVVSKEDVRETERTVREDFQQFGELEYVRAIPSKAIGFVRFKLRVAAEFAREAMNGQTTPYGMISCKWAHVDPNPLAKEFDRRADEALAQYAIAKRILEMPEEKRAAWKQMQMVQNGVYPTQDAPAPAPVATMAPAPAAAASSVAPAPGIPAIAAPPGVDPARAQAFAEYWAAFHAKKTAEQLGIEAPPEVQVVIAPPPPPAAVKAPAAPDLLTNPHTGEVVEAEFAVNPYSQAPHPYAYRDYGWNRPKKNKSEAEKKHRQQKRSAQEAMQGGDYDAQQDPNYSYGPAAGGGGGGARGNKRSNSSSGPNTVTPGKATVTAVAPGPVLLPGKGKKAVVASQAEQEALFNDEPLAFGE